MTGHYRGGALPFLSPAVPNVARIYDYLLGGKDNFEADRAAAAEIARLIPGSAQAARQNRAFLQRWFAPAILEAAMSANCLLA